MAFRYLETIVLQVKALDILLPRRCMTPFRSALLKTLKIRVIDTHVRALDPTRTTSLRAILQQKLDSFEVARWHNKLRMLHFDATLGFTGAFHAEAILLSLVLAVKEVDINVPSFPVNCSNPFHRRIRQTSATSSWKW